jgi:hypothetical protein
MQDDNPIGPLLEDIGTLVLSTAENPSLPTLIAMKFGDGVAGYSVYQVRDNDIVSIEPEHDDLLDDVYDQWKLSSHKFSEIWLTLKNGNYAGEPFYDDEIDPEEDEDDRHDRLVKHYLGDKPIL